MAAQEYATDSTGNRGNWQNLHPWNKYLPSVCHVLGKGGEAGNTAVNEKENYYHPWGAYILWGEVRGSAEITGK